MDFIVQVRKYPFKAGEKGESRSLHIKDSSAQAVVTKITALYEELRFKDKATLTFHKTR